VTDTLFSWKTRGQYALDHGGISAFAGLQKPPIIVGMMLLSLGLWIM